MTLLAWVVRYSGLRLLASGRTTILESYNKLRDLNSELEGTSAFPAFWRSFTVKQI